MFADNTIKEILDRTDLVEFIGEYVQLKKSGQGYQGLCPFHAEKTPSFHVSPMKGIFRCFGCDKGGNAIHFLRGIEGLSFPEAVERLANRAGVKLETVAYFKKTENAPSPKTLRTLDALEWAAKYFHYLLTETKEYAFAKEYINKRGITENTIKKFRIGVSPKNRDTLKQQMEKRGFLLEELVAAGLVGLRDDNSTEGYDRFRNRLMFPITDKEGKIIGFGGRSFDEAANPPKYLNSVDSPIFSKRKNLYGLYENQRGIRVKGEAIVVEGYMDVVGLYEAGVQNAVATMGTALTEEHCHELKNLTKQVVTVFDPDRAGQDAWHRSVHLFFQSKIFAKDLSLPDELDPDEFVLKESAEAFYKLCESAPRQITKYLKEIASNGHLTSNQVKKYLEEFTPILIATRNSPERAIIWDDIATVLNVTRDALVEIVERATKSIRNDSPQNAYPKRPVQKAREVLPPAPNQLDLEFLEIALRCPEHFLKTPEDKWKTAIRDPKVLEWLTALYSVPLEKFDEVASNTFQTVSHPKIMAHISAGLIREGGNFTEIKPETYYDLILERMILRRHEDTVRALAAQIKMTQRLGKESEALELMKKLKELRTSL